MLITVQRLVGLTSNQDKQRQAVCFRNYGSPSYKSRVYKLTDASLARIERLAVSKQTDRATFPAGTWIYNHYMF